MLPLIADSVEEPDSQGELELRGTRGGHIISDVYSAPKMQ